MNSANIPKKVWNSDYVKRVHRKRSLNFRSFQRKINPEAKFAIIPETTFLATSISLYYPGISNVTGNLHSKKDWVSEAYLMKRILKNSQPLRNFPTQDSILGRSDPKKICKTIHYPQYFTTHSTISVISTQNTQYYPSSVYNNFQSSLMG